jgi:hypothetical protein
MAICFVERSDNKLENLPISSISPAAQGLVMGLGMT